MINYSDFKKLLFPGNYIGAQDGLDETYGIPNDQTVHQEDGKYIITYSFFRSYSDITFSSYYAANSAEAQNFIDGDEYKQSIEDIFQNRIFAASVDNPQYVWFQEVANIKFSKTEIGTNDLNGNGAIDQPDEYTTGHIAIGQLSESYSHFNDGAVTAAVLPYDTDLFPDNTGLKHGDIFFNTEHDLWNGAIDYKDQSFKVVLEETLHSLGVDSRTEDAVGTIYNNQKYSVAAYQDSHAPGMFNFFSGTIVAPHTLQIMDIAALQEIYGRNYGSFAWNTDYTLSVMNPDGDDSAFLYTIWDGGGVDQINVSNSTVSAEIDLRQGRFSSIGKTAYGETFFTDKDATSNDPDPGNVAIAFHTVIENAVGSSKNDVLIGNDWINHLQGGKGNDYLYGDGASYDGDAGYSEIDADDPNDPNRNRPTDDNDILDGGEGRDTVSYMADTGSLGIDVVMNGTNGTVTRGSETDTLISIEVVEGTSGEDSFRGGDAKVLFVGGAGGDSYYLSEDSPIYLLEKQEDSGTDVLIVNGATTGETHGITGARGTLVMGDDDGEGFSGVFFIPNEIEAVNSGSVVSLRKNYTDTYGPVDAKQTVDGAYQLFLNSQEDNHYNNSPLVLDLDGDGITLAPIYGDGSVYFDLDNDGLAEATGWIAGNDGLLVIDKDGNGTIDNRDELFGNEYDIAGLTPRQTSNYTNGFKTLSDYDTNNDARISETDTQFSDLMVWTDVNSDGISQAGELHSLSSLGITEIGTGYTLVDEEVEGNPIYQKGSFVINGNTQEISDVWFTYDNVNSQYRGDTSVDLDVALLPDIRGYGQLLDWHITMSQNEDFKGLVSDYMSQSFAPEDIGSAEQVSALEQILYEWAGVRGEDYSHRLAFGEHETTGNDVVFTEKYFDRLYDGGGSVYNSGVIAISQALNNIMDDISAQVFFQSQDSDYLFTQKPIYNSVTHDFSGGFTFDSAAFTTEIQTFASDDITRLKYASNVLTMFKDALGFDGLSVTEINELETIVENHLSHWGVTLEHVSNVSIFAGNHDVYEEVSQADNLFIGRENEKDTINGYGGDDVILGLGGDDSLSAGDGNDRLDGGAGDDVLSGGDGDDTYVFSSGNDVVSDTGGFDTLVLGDGIVFADLSIQKTDQGSYFGTTNNLVISDADGNSIQFGRQFDYSSPLLDALQFSDGTTVLLSEIEIDSHGTEGNDSLSGIETGDLSTNDVMFGYGGNDTLSGLSGDDILHGGNGNDQLIGGAGNDTAYGEEGNDTVRGGQGSDTLYGNEGDDFIYGQEGDDTLFGGDGDDTLYGDDTYSSYAGDDTYYAGSGDDTIHDRYGDDVYYYTAGLDTINDGDGNDTIILADGVLSGDIQIFNAGSNDLLITINSTVSQGAIYLYNQRLAGEGIEALTLFDGTSVALVGANAINEIYGTFSSDANLSGDLSGVQDDHIYGLSGDDRLFGLSGNDTYYYTAGLDEIWDTDGVSDTIVLPEGVNVDDVIITRIDSNDIKINLIGDTKGTIIVHDYYSAADTVEYVRFHDNTQISLVETAHSGIYGTVKDDVLSGDLQGVSHDILHGLSGDDQLDGGDGDDSYIWSVGDGDDTITDTNGTDTLVLHEVSASDLTFISGAGNALIIRVNDETITINNQLRSDSQQNSAYDYHQIERLLLDDGSEIDLTNIVTFTGTSEGETIDGTHLGDDILEGLAGDDHMRGYEGDDTYVWSVGDGNDAITEAGGIDQLILHGVSENDLRFEYNKSPSNLKIYIGDEVITINSQYSAETYQIETVLLDDGTEINLLENMTFTGTNSNDYVYGITGSDNTLNGLEGDDRLYGSDTGNDIINGGGGSDILYGYGGNDTFTGGAGDDIVWAADGIDQAIFSGAFEDYTIVVSEYQGDSYGRLTVTDNVGNDGTDTLYSVEQLLFVNGIYENGVSPIAQDDAFSGYQGINITGNVLEDNGSGVDVGPAGETLTVLAGTFITGNGVVTLSATGDFTYSPNTDQVTSDSFSYIISAENGKQDTGVISWTLNPVPQDTINGTSGNDTLIGDKNSVSNDTINGNAGNDTVYGISGHDLIFGGAGNDGLNGGAGNDLIDGGDGGDTLSGSTGNDTLIGGVDFDRASGGEGDDTYIFRVGDSSSQASGSSYTEEYIDEDAGEGIDTIKFEGVDASDVRIWTNSSGDYQIQYSSTDFIDLDSSVSDRSIASTFEFIEFDDGTVWDLRDALYVIDTDDDRPYSGRGHISGAATNDYMDGRGGNDEIHGQGGDDHILGGDGDDRLYGEGRNSDGTAGYGIAGNDILEGGAGSDVLYGNLGNDTLIGGADDDWMNGGGGFDQAIFTGNYEDYTVSQIFNSIFGYFQGGYRVTSLSGDEGVDSVYDVEELVFANGRYVHGTFILNGEHEDNTGPIAQNDTFSGVENTTLVGNLFSDNGFGVDFDPDGDAFSALALTTRSDNDAEVVIQANGDFEYIANTNFNGTDSFTYIIYDQKGGQSTATVSITISEVNNPPLAYDDRFIGSQNTDLFGNVINGLGNTNIIGNYLSDQNNVYDRDPDGDALSVTAGIYATSNGSVTLFESGDFTYTPNVGFTGSDSFVYTLNDDAGNSSNANVNIDVYQDVQIDDIAGEDFFSGDQNGISNDTILGRGGNDFVLAGYGNDRLFGHDGNDTLYGSYDNDYIEGGGGNDNLYGSSGNDVYFYGLGDGHDTLSESYLSDEDYDAGAKNGGYDIIQFGAGISYWDIQQTTTGFQNGDLELNVKNQGSITIENQNNGGALVKVEQLLFEDGSKMSLVNYTGHFLHVQDHGGAGSYTFGTSYDDVFVMNNTVGINISSGAGNDEVRYNSIFSDYNVVLNANNMEVVSDTHTDILWNVESIVFADGIFENGAFVSINSVPVAKDDDFTVNQNTPVIGNLLVDNGNGVDSDLDGDVLSVVAGTIVTANGSVIISTNGDFTYTPNLDYWGADSFVYTVMDSLGQSDVATARIVVEQVIVNTDPVAADDVVVVNEDESVIVDVLANDGDLDGDTLTVSIASGSANGSLTVNGDNTITYTPNVGYYGIDNFTYMVDDGQGGQDTATVTVTINSIDDTLIGTSVVEIFDGGIGIDTVDYSASVLAVDIDLSAGTASGGDAAGDTLISIENIIGSDASGATQRDNLVGNDVVNHLQGLGGNDYLEGLGGADIIDGGSGWDIARYTNSDAGVEVNLLTGVHTGGHAEGDTLIDIEAVVGSLFGDTLIGGASNDYLSGHGGNDDIEGGAGADTINGGSGWD
ncbi:MAG: Ig-like domain-containing protein, partial [Alphaproteobacteria bacterium]